MDEYLVNGSLALTRGSLLRLDDARDMLIYVWEGEVWLTQENDRNDYLLKAGEWFRLDRDGAAVAYALRRSSLTLTAPRPTRQARRIQLARSGTTAPVTLYDAALAGGAA